MPRTPSFARALIAAVTSVALVGAGVVALGHHVEERHEVCAEHGELVHVEAGEVAVYETARPQLTDSDPDSEHGDHCAIAWSAPESPEGPDAAAGKSPAVDRDGASEPVVRLVATSGLYRLAPKSSPPS